MATKQWKTVSIRLDEEEENALKMLCQKREQKKHALLKDLLLKELEPILKPGQLAEGEGIPLIGGHVFKYSPERDDFTWQIDLGVHGIHPLAENIQFSFINNLYAALGKSIEERQIIENKTSKKKTRFPKSLLKYKVKQNA